MEVPQVEPKELMDILLFGTRHEIAKAAEEKCVQSGLHSDPHNIVTALNNLGLINKKAARALAQARRRERDANQS